MILSYSYSDCSATMTATQSVLIDGTEFYAIPETFMQYIPSQQLIVTYHYPAVTLTSLHALETLAFVSPVKNVTNIQAGTVTGTTFGDSAIVDHGSLSFT